MSHKFAYAFSTIALLTGVTFAAPVSAAPVEKVLAACDRTAGCGYSAGDNGDIVGCSKTSNTCFYCPADGSRQCISVRKTDLPRARLRLMQGTFEMIK